MAAFTRLVRVSAKRRKLYDNREWDANLMCCVPYSQKAGRGPAIIQVQSTNSLYIQTHRAADSAATPSKWLEYSWWNMP